MTQPHHLSALKLLELYRRKIEATRRFDDAGVLHLVRAWEQMRPTERPWPTPPS